MFPEEHHLQKAGMIMFCCTGDQKQAEEAIRPFREVAIPIIDAAGPIPFPALQTILDGLMPPGLQWYWNSDLFTEMSDAAIETH